MSTEENLYPQAAQISRKVDGNVERKTKNINNLISLKEDTKEFLPSIIEFSSSGLCNRKCIFCPRSSPDYDHVNQHFSQDNMKKLSGELKEYSKNYYFLFSGFSEPLLTKHLEELISILRNDHNNALIEINTNTDLLTQKRIKSLFESGLSSIICSIYDDEKRLFEVEDLLNKQLSPSQYKLRPRFYKKDEDGDKALTEFGLTLSNRAGMMENAGFSIATLKEPLQKPCFYPFYNIFIDYNGDVLPCPHDWGKGELLGNISKDHIISDIWNSPRLNKVRANLLKAKRGVSNACKKCDVDGTLMGNEQAKLWEKITN